MGIRGLFTGLGAYIGASVTSMVVGAELGAKGGTVVGGPFGTLIGAAAGAAAGFVVGAAIDATGFVVGAVVDAVTDHTNATYSPMIHEHKINVRGASLDFVEEEEANESRCPKDEEDVKRRKVRQNEENARRSSAGGNQPPTNENERQEVKECQSLEQLLAKLKELLQKLERIRQSGQRLNAQEQCTYFELLTQYLNRLISFHGATVEREHQNPGVIFLVAGSTRITLDGSIRDLFHFQPDTSELTGSATDGSANDAIYGIWCNRCNGYVYAGQSVSVQRRACGHHTTMKYKSDSLLGKHAREHFTSDYDRIFSLDVVWRVDLGHSTYRKLQANSPEAKKLRSWEIFFQWFFKVHVDEGGCSKK